VARRVMVGAKGSDFCKKGRVVGKHGITSEPVVKRKKCKAGFRKIVKNGGGIFARGFFAFKRVGDFLIKRRSREWCFTERLRDNTGKWLFPGAVKRPREEREGEQIKAWFPKFAKTPGNYVKWPPRIGFTTCRLENWSCPNAFHGTGPARTYIKKVETLKRVFLGLCGCHYRFALRFG